MFTFRSDTILIVFMIVQVEVVISSNQTQELSIKYIIFMYGCSVIDKARACLQRRYLRTPLRGDCNAIYELCGECGWRWDGLIRLCCSKVGPSTEGCIWTGDTLYARTGHLATRHLHPLHPDKYIQRPASECGDDELVNYPLPAICLYPVTA